LRKIRTMAGCVFNYVLMIEHLFKLASSNCLN
jgi:hypothetical protein